MSAIYDTDFYAWANEQASLLRRGKLAEADIANIAEEIESMGRTEKRELAFNDQGTAKRGRRPLGGQSEPQIEGPGGH